MIITEKKPSGELSLFTESFWQCDLAAGEELIIFPDGTFNILIFLSPGSINNVIYDQGIYLSNFQTRIVRCKSKSRIFGIRLKAFSLPNISKSVGLKIDQLAGITSLSIGSNSNRYFHQWLSKLIPFDEALPFLQQLNYQLLQKDLLVHASLRDKINFVLDRKGNVNIDEMSNTFGVSRQALHKSFKKSLGISPKQLSTIWRLNHYFSIYQDTNSQLNSTYEVGFYDQAHGIKSFKQSFGHAPKQFFNQHQENIQFIHDTIQNRFNNRYDPE